MQDEIASAYDRWAQSYDVDRNATRDLDEVVLRRSGLSLGDADVLEIGCGTGKNSAWLAAHARALTAMDFSPGMLARARERVTGAHVRFVQHDLREPWPIPASSHDIVVGNLVLEHIEHLSSVFANAMRVMRPGGTLLLCELHPFRQWTGGQAHFFASDTGERVQVPACIHSISDYVNGGLEAGLTLERIGEWTEDAAEVGVLPRLLSVRFVKR